MHMEARFVCIPLKESIRMHVGMHKSSEKASFISVNTGHSLGSRSAA